MHNLKIYSSLNCQTVNISGNHHWKQEAEHYQPFRISSLCFLPGRTVYHPRGWLLSWIFSSTTYYFCLLIFRLHTNYGILCILFCLTCLWDPFIWLHIVVFHSFSWLYGTLVSENTTIHLCFTISVHCSCFQFLAMNSAVIYILMPLFFLITLENFVVICEIEVLQLFKNIFKR